MVKQIRDSYIISKKYIDTEDYSRIIELKNECLKEEDINLKLELDYKINVFKEYEENANEINEFLYYVNDNLVGYVSICSFDGSTLEITGMVNPSFRRRGIFKKLCSLAIEESKRRGNNKILLLFDSKSKFANLAIEEFNCDYSFSEYLMNRNNKLLNSNLDNKIELFKVDSNNLEKVKSLAEEIFEEVIDRLELNPSSVFYLLKKENTVIGKIKLSFDKDNYAGFISWFGIRKEFRRLGYGKSALNKALEIFNKEGIYNVSLEVNESNSNALNLYKNSGFKEVLVMNYYKYIVKT